MTNKIWAGVCVRNNRAAVGLDKAHARIYNYETDGNLQTWLTEQSPGSLLYKVWLSHLYNLGEVFFLVEAVGNGGFALAQRRKQNE